MMITLLDVLSDAVKIGGGAAIAGYFAYRNAKAADERMAKLEYVRERREMLKQVALDFEVAHRAIIGYDTALFNWLDREDVIAADEELRETYSKANDAMEDTMHMFMTVYTSLLLIGDENSLAAYEEYDTVLTELSNSWPRPSDDKDWSDALPEQRHALQQKRSHFAVALGEAFKKLD